MHKGAAQRLLNEHCPGFAWSLLLFSFMKRPQEKWFKE